jgi:hypothetical protein
MIKAAKAGHTLISRVPEPPVDPPSSCFILFTPGGATALPTHSKNVGNALTVTIGSGYNLASGDIYGWRKLAENIVSR